MNTTSPSVRFSLVAWLRVAGFLVSFLSSLLANPSPMWILASYLDPRCKSFDFVSHPQWYTEISQERRQTMVKAAKEYVVHLGQHFDKQRQNEITTSSASSSCAATTANTAANSLSDSLVTFLQESWRRNMRTPDMATQIAAWDSTLTPTDKLKIEQIDQLFDSSVIARCPTVFEMAKSFLALPASTAPAERVWRNLGHIEEVRKREITKDTFRSLAFAKSNQTIQKMVSK